MSLPQEPTGGGGRPRKDFWDVLDVLLRPLSSLFAAIVVALIGYFGSKVLEDSKRLENAHRERLQQMELNNRLYTELISRREESESALRKDMFVSIINSFLSGGQGMDHLEEKLLNLELLVYNFHESLNLKPLFSHLRREIIDEMGQVQTELSPLEEVGLLNVLAGEEMVASEDEDTYAALKQKEEVLPVFQERLLRIAREVSAKQSSILEGAGQVVAWAGEINQREPVIDEFLEIDGLLRRFSVSLRGAVGDREIQVRLQITNPVDLDEGGEEALWSTPLNDEVNASFSLGFFDFPMIDNSRLSQDQRCAVVLSNYFPEEGLAEIRLIYFPGTHASLREKPYIEEIMNDLLEIGEREEARYREREESIRENSLNLDDLVPFTD
ncbi:MAG: hypothetical protein AAF555_00860 [Verrucomicrobiota bacterium]